jgi:sugar-phosphatase
MSRAAAEGDRVGRFAAILCDLDGVLVDSGDSVERIWREWAAERGLDADRVARESHGVPSREVIAALAPELLAQGEAERVDARHAATGGIALPGAAELLARPPLPLAVVTSCTGPLARARFAAAGLPEPGHLITVDDVARGKPAPDPYLAGAAVLGAEPGECLVVEDSPAGVAAGRGAGMTVWAVTTTHPAHELQQAHAVWPDLHEVARHARAPRPAPLRRAGAAYGA